MIKPQNWDNTSAVMGAGFPKLPAGKYVCKVVNVKIGLSKNGAEMLTFAVDVAEGEYKDFFRKQFDRKKETNSDAKWPCQYYQLTQGDSMGRFKGLLAAFELSNPGYTWQWGTDCELSLRGLKIGGIFREEEYLGNDGKKHDSVKCYALLPTDDLEEATVPPKKMLDQAGNGFGRQSLDEEIPF